MGSQFYTPKVRSNENRSIVLGSQPFNRDNIALAFGKIIRSGLDGQDLAGSGALVFEGEVLDLPRWH